MKYILPILLLSLLTACGHSSEEKSSENHKNTKDTRDWDKAKGQGF